MSKIITPTDTILIEINNLANPPRVTVKTTGQVTNIGAIGIMSTLITEFAKNIVQQGMAESQMRPPAIAPAVDPSVKPPLEPPKTS